MSEFNFYNSENDGYRGGFGGYVDPEPVMPGTPLSTGGMKPPKRKKNGAAKVVALVLACTRGTAPRWRPFSTPTADSPCRRNSSTPPIWPPAWASR